MGNFTEVEVPCLCTGIGTLVDFLHCARALLQFHGVEWALLLCSFSDKIKTEINQAIYLGCVGKRRLERPTPTSRT